MMENVKPWLGHGNSSRGCQVRHRVDVTDANQEVATKDNSTNSLSEVASIG